MENFINKIICGDSAEVLKGFPDNCIDLIVTSPPYDDIRNYESGFNFSFEVISNELYRVLKEGGVIVWVVADRTVDGSETGTSFKQALHFKKIGLNIHDTMIYSKGSFAFPEDRRYHNIFEYMFVFSKGRPKTFNPIKDRVIKHKNKRTKKLGRRHVDELKYEYCNIDVDPGEKRKRFNIWEYSPGKHKTTKDNIAYEHPAIMHEGIAKDHILSWSNPGDIVLDPFVGSGTVPKISWLLNRNYIGIDISEKYVKITKERIKKHTRQKRLFR